MCDLFELETHEQRTFICREGDACDRLYVVVQGTVRAAVTDPDGGEREVAVHEKGGYFNDHALVDSRRCEATVQVRTRRAVCLALRWERFQHVHDLPGIYEVGWCRLTVSNPS